MAKQKPAPESAAPATDENPAPAPASEPAAPAATNKPRIAEHDWIDANGDVVESIEEATGIKYRQLATDESMTWQIPGAVPGSIQTMMAAFGARTKATNSTLAAREKRKRDNTFTTSDVAHMKEIFAQIQVGQWGAPSEGGVKRGPKYDLDVLTAVICAMIEAEGGSPDPLKIRAKCGDSPAYVRGAIAMTDENGVRVIEREYNKRKGIVAAPKKAMSLLVD